ncbi:hypothetical protein HMPREF3213_03779 [Heyndrickxia coagulans]|uniref:Uncharacterized protein n=1 Tax=Heyndrickxia coagulans TaxID=1398 RepID=A0A133KAJ7_HEYCO|nr:hypothetical protein HMPREF3213_03779 [Heyndrickxia coagulans]
MAKARRRVKLRIDMLTRPRVNVSGAFTKKLRGRSFISYAKFLRCHVLLRCKYNSFCCRQTDTDISGQAGKA